MRTSHTLPRGFIGNRWLAFLNFWSGGYYNGSGHVRMDKLINRYFCWIGRHGFTIPYSVKLDPDETLESIRITAVCPHCGYTKVFRREVEMLYLLKK